MKAIRITGGAPAAALTGLLAMVGALSGCASVAPTPMAPPPAGAVAQLDRLNAGPCNRVVASALAGSGIAMADVRDLTYGLYRDIKRDRITGYDAWITLRDQPGNIVVSLDALCRPIQIYARGGAHLPSAR